MAILAVDEVMLREPRLLVPRLGPVGRVKVDWQNPLSAGLLGVFMPADGGRMTRTPTTLVGSVSPSPVPPTIIGAQHGLAWKNNYGDSCNYVKVERSVFNYTARVTFEALLVVDAFQITKFPYMSGIISQYQYMEGGGAFYGPILRFNGTADIGDAAKPVFLVIGTGGSAQTAVSSTALSTGVLYHIVGVYDGTAVRLYVDGRQVASTDYTGSFENDTRNWISLMSDYTSSNGDDPGDHNRALNGRLYLARIYSTAKTPTEIAALSADPYQLLIPA